jgi:hypothetical protein
LLELLEKVQDNESRRKIEEKREKMKVEIMEVPEDVAVEVAFQPSPMAIEDSHWDVT